MRLKRLCSKTSAGKLQVPDSVHQQWLTGDRTQLELAMTQALKQHGFDTSHRVRQQVRVWVCPKDYEPWACHLSCLVFSNSHV